MEIGRGFGSLQGFGMWVSPLLCAVYSHFPGAEGVF